MRQSWRKWGIMLCQSKISFKRILSTLETRKALRSLLSRKSQKPSSMIKSQINSWQWYSMALPHLPSKSCKLRSWVTRLHGEVSSTRIVSWQTWASTEKATASKEQEQVERKARSESSISMERSERTHLKPSGLGTTNSTNNSSQWTSRSSRSHLRVTLQVKVLMQLVLGRLLARLK